MSADFAGRRVLVTGAAGLYGRELVGAFAQAGARVVATDHPSATWQASPPADGAVERIPADLTCPADIDALAAAASDPAPPDVLVNCAGIYPFGDVLDATVEQCDLIFAVNLRAPFLLTQALARRWIERSQSASVVNISSAAAEVVRLNGLLYGPSKAALEQLTRLLAIRLGPHGIRVNAVRPGIADDPSAPHIPAEHMQKLARSIPLGRTIAPGELAEMVLFLSSDRAAFVTGQIVTVDGGNAVNRR